METRYYNVTRLTTLPDGNVTEDVTVESTMVPVYYDRRHKVVFNCLSNFTTLREEHGIQIDPSYLPLEYWKNVTEFNFAPDTYHSPSKTARYTIHVCYPQDEAAIFDSKMD